jgi:hypothetical protein
MVCDASQAQKVMMRCRRESLKVFFGRCDVDEVYKTKFVCFVETLVTEGANCSSPRLQILARRKEGTHRIAYLSLPKQEKS